jgi:hypothetical protein
MEARVIGRPPTAVEYQYLNCRGGEIMEGESLKKAKQCCSHEFDRLKENLSRCDSQFETPAERHRCYRVVAKRSGHRSKKCMLA